MKAETYLFAGVALFFAITATVYAWFSMEPAGTAALSASFLFSAAIAAYSWRQHLRHGRRLQDRKDAPVHEAAGVLDFFPPHSYAPVLTALACAVLGLGVIYGFWLFLIGLGVLTPGIAGFVFQFNDRGTGGD